MQTDMNSKQEALQEIVSIAKNHQLTVREITAAFSDEQRFSREKSGSTLSRIFGIVGSILIFTGVCIYIGMQWDHLGSAARIVVTLGLGFTLFLLALVAMTITRYESVATPFLLIAALLQPTGIFVMLNEYSRGGDPLHGLLFMSTLMLIQQGAVFWQTRRTALAFTTVFFGFSFFITAFELLEIDSNISWLVTGFSLMLIGWALDHSRHHVISAFWYFIGAITLLIAAFRLLEDQFYEVLYIGLTAFIIYISTVARSRTLLVVGTIAMIGYISHFTSEHFSNTLGWPIVLIICGIVFIVFGSIAMKINAKYIRLPN